MECQKALTVALAKAFAGVGEQVSQKALLMVRVWLAKEASEGLEGRHFGGSGIQEGAGASVTRYARRVAGPKDGFESSETPDEAMRPPTDSYGGNPQVSR